MGWVKYLMNSLSSLSYNVYTLFTYKTSDRYRGFIIQVKKKPPEEEEEGETNGNIKQRNKGT
jgi:hypothetical protein